MLSPLWWLPLAVAAGALVPIWWGTRRLVEEAAGLQGAIAQLALVEPLVDQVKAELAGLAANVPAPRANSDLGPR